MPAGSVATADALRIRYWRALPILARNLLSSKSGRREVCPFGRTFGATRPPMLQLHDIDDTSGGPRFIERQQTAVTAAAGGNSLPLRLPRPFFNEVTICL
jgi:hypothetical protein